VNEKKPLRFSRKGWKDFYSSPKKGEKGLEKGRRPGVPRKKKREGIGERENRGEMKVPISRERRGQEES